LMLVREHVKQVLEQVEPGDEVEVIWNDAVMIQSRSPLSLLTDDPKLFELARAVMQHRGVFLKVVELEKEHYVMFLLVKVGSRMMMPRRGQSQATRKVTMPTMLCIPVALISQLRIVKKSKRAMAEKLYQHAYVIPAKYVVISLIPEKRMRR